MSAPTRDRSSIPADDQWFRGDPRSVGSVIRDLIPAILLLNAPFVLFHPDWPLIDVLFVRSLGVIAVLFIAPGLPLVAVMRRKGWVSQVYLLWVVVASWLVFAFLLVGVHVVRLTVAAGLLWNATWVVTNLGLLLNAATGGPPPIRGGWPSANLRRHLVLFAVAYSILYWGAARVVPALGDQDVEVQFTTQGLLTQLTPRVRTWRQTDYYFAHPPLLHVYVAESLLYFNLLPARTLGPSWAIPAPGAWDPHLVEARTPNLFFGASTAAFIGMWIAGTSSSGTLGLLMLLAYITSPEVFVRSAYGGYFAISVWVLLQVLWTLAQAETLLPAQDRRRTAFIGGLFAAVADHKMILLPIAVAIWEYLRSWNGAARRAFRHPVVMGFAVGTAIFWAYGLSISPADFWMEHIRHHVVDRIANYNARGFDLSLYPNRIELWTEFARHSGYVLAPLGLLALAIRCRPAASDAPDTVLQGWRGSAGLWGIWILSMALAFSVVDWRQTKHLAPILPVLYLGIGTLAAGRLSRLVVASVLMGLLLWNVSELRMLAVNFDSLVVRPGW